VGVGTNRSSHDSGRHTSLDSPRLTSPRLASSRLTPPVGQTGLCRSWDVEICRSKKEGPDLVSILFRTAIGQRKPPAAQPRKLGGMLGGSRCKAGPTLEPATNPRLSGFPSQSAHASASASARTNDHLYSTVSSVDVQVPWDRLQCSRVRVLGQDTQSVFGVWRWALDVAQRSYPGLPVCIGGMKSRPPFSAVSPTIT
jgi:hypothetical protein